MIILRIFCALAGVGAFLLGQLLTSQASLIADPSIDNAVIFTKIVGIVFMICGAVIFYASFKAKRLT